MSVVTINGKEYTIPEMTFDAVCELEENGVELLNINSKHPKLATTMRGLVAWVMNVDTKTASHEISEHIAHGGNIVDILTAITDEMGRSGFFGRKTEGEKVAKMPQDHQRPKYNNRKRKNTNRSQN